jgi:hypothetical protein
MTKEELHFDEEDEELLDRIRKKKTRNTFESVLNKKSLNRYELDELMGGETDEIH